LDMNPFPILFHGLKSPSCQAFCGWFHQFIKCVNSVLLGWGLGDDSIPWDLTSSLAFLANQFDVWISFNSAYAPAFWKNSQNFQFLTFEISFFFLSVGWSFH
jgi:hypothetical protein